MGTAQSGCPPAARDRGCSIGGHWPPERSPGGWQGALAPVLLCCLPLGPPPPWGLAFFGSQRTERGDCCCSSWVWSEPGWHLSKHDCPLHCLPLRSGLPWGTGHSGPLRAVWSGWNEVRQWVVVETQKRTWE